MPKQEKEQVAQSIPTEKERDLTKPIEKTGEVVVEDRKKEAELITKVKKAVKKSTPQTDDQEIKSETRKQVESIMENDLVDIYKTMDPKTQQEFKDKGKEVATKLEIMIETVKIKARSVLELFRDWLGMIPGINKFFLDQEAKIKVDQIMAYSKKRKKQIKLKNKNKI